MSEQKEKADAPQKQSANTNSDTKVSKSKPKVKKKNSKGKRILTMESSVKTFAIKCYEEQMPDGWEKLKGRIVEIDGKRIQILAIKHDKDPATDDIWDPSMEKPHYHIIGRLLDNKNLKIRTILKTLGIVFRPGEDDNLWQEGGVETVRDFAGYAMYLTHETEAAMLDGKHIYDISELISNMDMDSIKQVRDGYIRVSTTNKVGAAEMAEIDELARKLGYELGDFKDWYFNYPLAIRKQSAMKQVRESYNYGVEQRVSEMKNIVRCCIYIQGGPNLGKTYASIKALEGFRTLPISGGGTGKFDDLLPSHEAMVIDDYTCSNLLNLSDNRPVKAYKRQNNNPYWCGKYLVVTSNLPFKEWAEECGLKTEKYMAYSGYVQNESFKALLTRWFICDVEEKDGVKRLRCKSPATRGKDEEQLERKEMYIHFRDKFNSVIRDYKPKETTVTYDDLNDYNDGGFIPVTDDEEEELPFD